MTTIGMYIGTQNDQTKQLHEKQPWAKYTSDYTVEAFGSASLPSSVKEHYNVVRTTPRNPDGPFSRIYAAIRDGQEYLKNHDPDVLLQLMRTPTHAPGISIIGLIYDIPVITRYSGDGFNIYKARKGFSRVALYSFSNFIGRIPLELSAKMIALGPYTKKLLIDRGFDPDDIKIIPIEIQMDGMFSAPSDIQETRNEVDLPLDKDIILYSGRLTELKGMEFMIEVMEQTLQKSDSVLFVLGGEGPYRTQINNQFSSETVCCPGYIPYEDIHLYYKAADAYVHPSPFEGLPLSILEALKCETPVIAREAGDISFVTPNIVSTSSEMANRILNREWSSEWLHKSEFDTNRNKQKFEKMVEEILQ